MFIVAEQYEFVIGVDTHAATHTLSVITAATGAVIERPCSRRRRRAWIGH